MMFTIVIILIVVLILTAVAINAVQQHKNKVESEKRAELGKLKTIIDETDDLLAAMEHLPVTNHMHVILLRRIVNALKQSLNYTTNKDTKSRIRDTQQQIDSINVEENNNLESRFNLPDNEKLIIALLQGIKRIRIILRSENHKGKIDPKLFVEQDRMLDRYQLKVNIETIKRRVHASLQSKMLGSARQYLEKGLAALKAQKVQDEYVTTTLAELTSQLNNIHQNMRDANAADTAKRVEESKDELDELFAPKKKW
ncbi:hypothetical protein QX776_02870 [Alteromonadaceae bacterium BrNp21-10]|nr:hypothetical protein [Alteromonadaceae bacterium BrNp21-10]